MAEEATSEANVEVEKFKREINDLQIAAITSKNRGLYRRTYFCFCLFVYFFHFRKSTTTRIGSPKK
jgi:hypothetical protein